jgi:superfamily I DNA/RNA helicase
MPEYGPEGAVLPPPSKGGQVQVATIHRYKGPEAPVVVLAEIDARVASAARWGGSGPTLLQRLSPLLSADISLPI